MQFLIIMVLMLGVMYVLMIRPQRQRQAQQQSMIDGATVGDDVLTTGGIYGTIAEVEGDDIVVEIATGVTVHMTRRGIAAVLPPEDEEDEQDEEVEELEDAEEQDESAVMDGEEAVSAAAGDISPGEDRR
ncbi:MAG TPA: preprotein translocase subunit YajC [Gaiellaceae bacterium]|nr:preprotein translocase subunit YajC [Gaiellaceae bacterium]